MKAQDVATKGDVLEIRREIAEMKVEIIKWVLGIAGGQAAILLTAMKFFSA